MQSFHTRHLSNAWKCLFMHTGVKGHMTIHFMDHFTLSVQDFQGSHNYKIVLGHLVCLPINTIETPLYLLCFCTIPLIIQQRWQAVKVIVIYQCSMVDFYSTTVDWMLILIEWMKVIIITLGYEKYCHRWGLGSDITWIKIIMYWNHLEPNYCLVAVILQQWCHFLGPHPVQYFLRTHVKSVFSIVLGHDIYQSQINLTDDRMSHIMKQFIP